MADQTDTETCRGPDGSNACTLPRFHEGECQATTPAADPDAVEHAQRAIGQSLVEQGFADCEIDTGLLLEAITSCPGLVDGLLGLHDRNERWLKEQIAWAL